MYLLTFIIIINVAIEKNKQCKYVSEWYPPDKVRIGIKTQKNTNPSINIFILYKIKTARFLSDNGSVRPARSEAR